MFHAQLNFETLIFSGKVPATLSGNWERVAGPPAPNKFFLIIKIPVASPTDKIRNTGTRGVATGDFGVVSARV